jgi:hypothetical protein
MPERARSYWWLWVLVLYGAYACWDDHEKHHQQAVDQASADADWAAHQAKASGDKAEELERKVSDLEDENARLRSQVEQLESQRPSSAGN